MTPLPLLIAGGGIGGLAAALAVARTGRAVRVLEREPRFGEIGAGLQLAPNASRALARLGVLDAIAPYAVFPRRIVWRDARTAAQVTALDLGDAFRAHFGYPYAVMHRGDLLDVLLEACRADTRIVLEASRAVVDVEDRTGGVRAVCADGTTYSGTALVAADGLWSRLRKLVHDDGDPVAARYVAYRGTLPVAELWEGAGLDDVTLWTAPDLHFVQYPIRGGQLFNQVAVFRSDRYRPDSDDWGTPDELDARFAASCAAVQAGIARIGRDRHWTMYDREPIAQWSRGRLVLLGDAAHPMLQYLAQGACQALEDAVVLGDALAAHDDSAVAFEAYRDRRYLRTARVQYSARLFGEIWHVGDVGATLRDAMLAGRRDDDFGHVEWLYGWRP
ncbi:MAG: 3-hydroxybenzoate 6-monooxygenase [Candidatus Eremiobacteraeota bacterium]|jgi:salicylate hydroxylase|nr:3-hydroxybenzoate 6-monooxygenase [Candidatus Eremiobacteraeota bacterium]